MGTMRIGVDAMGGDYAPRAVVEGVLALRGLLQSDFHLVLFGDVNVLREEFQRFGASVDDYDVVHCSEVVTMHDHGVQAMQKKSDSSVAVGFQWLASGRIDGFASAGNTGAMMAGAMLYIKAVPGILRPSIATHLPIGDEGYALLLDVGLNSDCKPEVLVQYGLLGSLYAQFVLGVTDPRVALLNIGSESEKGSVLARQTHELMARTGRFRFVGNIEGGQLFSGEVADVVVCDGFVGNIVLKEAEAFYQLAKQRGVNDSYFERFNFENYGGTPVLGVNSPVIIGHGVSNGKAIARMILQTGTVIASGLCDRFKKAFSDV